MIWPFRRREKTLSDEHSEAIRQLAETRNKSADVERLADDLKNHGRTNNFHERLFAELERTRRRPHDRRA